MKILTLVRHSIAQEPEETDNDFTRTLTKKGISLAYKVAAKVSQEHLNNVLFISSSAPRAYQTAQIFAEYHKIPEKQIVVHNFLYNCFKEQSFFYFLEEIAEKSSNCWIFGHNPMLSNLFAMLQNKQSLSLPKCAVAIFNTKAVRWLDVNHLNTHLIEFINPKFL